VAQNKLHVLFTISSAPLQFDMEAVGKRPSAALPSSLITAAYFYVGLVPRDFGSLASGHFPSASEKPDFRQFCTFFSQFISRRVR
jgi:hypothetical protein